MVSLLIGSNVHHYDDKKSRRLHQTPADSNICSIYGSICFVSRNFTYQRTSQVMSMNWNELALWMNNLATRLNGLLPAIFGLTGTLIGAYVSYWGQSKAQKSQFEEARKDRVRSEIVTLAASAEKWMQKVLGPCLLFQGATFDAVTQMLSGDIGNELSKTTDKVENSLNYLLFYVKDKELHRKLADFYLLWDKRLDNTIGVLTDETLSRKDAFKATSVYIGKMRRSLNQVKVQALKTLPVSIADN